MKLCLSLVLLVFVPLAKNQPQARYDNYQVFAITAQSEDATQLLLHLKSSSDSLMFMDSIQIYEPVNVVVAPHKLPDIIDILERSDMDYNVVSEDFQTILNEEANDTQKQVSEYNWDNYQDLEKTYLWMLGLSKKYKQVTFFKAGETFEKRNIMGVKISHKPGNKVIFLEAGIHAREWIAPATATFIIHQLLSSNVTSVRRMAESYDWYIIPHCNPDGYVYSRRSQRFWRKTRSCSRFAFGSCVCYGTDPNRNWDDHWNTVGSTNDPCSEIYPGRKPFSEIETYSLSKFMRTVPITLYIDMHAYSQFLMYPYGYTSKPPANIKDYRQIYKATVQALARRYGTNYTGGSLYSTVGPNSGSSVDWVIGKLGVPISLIYELRPKSRNPNGFALPPNQIIPNGLEVLDSMVALVNEARKLGYL